MRGIAFRDQQKVCTKGSEVGYSLATIEKMLSQKQTLKVEPQQQKIQNALRPTCGPERHSDNRIEKQVQNKIQGTAKMLLKQDQGGGGDDSSSITDEQKRRKKQKHRH